MFGDGALTLPNWSGWSGGRYRKCMIPVISALTSPPLCIMAPGEDTARRFLEVFQNRTQGELRFERYEDGGRLFAAAAIDAQASKECALAFLCLRWGLSAQQVMALGDSAADMGMLSWAGIGIAMGNAPSEIVHGARWVVLSNDESGVAWAIRRFVLDEGEQR